MCSLYNVSKSPVQVFKLYGVDEELKEVICAAALHDVLESFASCKPDA